MAQEASKNFYLIVEFPKEVNENESIPAAIVSSTWVFEDSVEEKLYCWWPNFRSDAQRKKAVIHHCDIDVDNCMRCEVHIKYKTDIYQKAVVKLKQLEINSDCTNTEEDKDRKKKGTKRYSDDFSYKLSDLSGQSSDTSYSAPTPPKHIKTTSEKENIQINKLHNVDNVKGITSLPTTSVNNIDIQSLPIIIESTADTLTCPSCQTNEGLATQILRVVESNSKKIDELTRIVNAALQEKMGQNIITFQDEFDGFPLKTIEDLNMYEEGLNDREQHVKMIELFKFIGGKDTFDTVRRVMSKMLENTLALRINWMGRNNKPAFKTYKNTLSVVTDATRKTPLCKNSTEQEIYTVIKQWLRGAIDRGGGRLRRQKENTPTENE